MDPEVVQPTYCHCPTCELVLALRAEEDARREQSWVLPNWEARVLEMRPRALAAEHAGLVPPFVWFIDRAGHIDEFINSSTGASSSPQPSATHTFPANAVSNGEANAAAATPTSD
jgi:hypothetical protein